MRMNCGWKTSGAVALSLAGSLLVSGCFSNGNETQSDEPRIIGGLIDTDTVLEDLFDDPNKPDYIVEQSLLVRAKLEVEPGVVIAFSRDTNIFVDGETSALRAAGTAENPVVFTGRTKTPGFWQGIFFKRARVSSNALEWAVVEYGGGLDFGSGVGAANVGAHASDVTITDTTIRHSAGHGIEFDRESSFRSFARNHFEGNAKVALRTSVEQRGKIDPTTTGLEGGIDLVSNVDMTLDTAATWQPLAGGGPTRILKTSFVKAPLVIEPGVELQFGDNVAMYIEGEGGSLSARGTADAPITMTSLGDARWTGLYYQNSQSSNNRLEHVTIDRAGSGSFLHRRDDHAALIIGAFVGSSSVVVTDSTISNSVGDGIIVDANSTVNDDVEEVNSFINNSGQDVVRR